MKKSVINRVLAGVLAISAVISQAGCAAPAPAAVTEESFTAAQETSVVSVPTEANPTEDAPVPAETTVPTTVATEPTETAPMETAPAETTEPRDEYGMTEQQRNSFSMLYYLAITAEEIRIAKDNRLMLDDIYTALMNDINPGAIDEITQDHLESLRYVIKSYIKLSTKRERLQYIHNQNKAEAIRSAVPNPMAILSMVQSPDWKKLAVSAVFTVVDSYNNYKRSSEAADQEFLMSGWELDDEETENIQRNRESAFDYMVDMVQEYGLDGRMTLNERAVNTFAEICAIESVQERSRRLESEEDTYKLFGNYWLERADCYFETDQYRKCLECVDRYNKLSTGIYRMDYNYVQILPKAIVAAQHVYFGKDYVEHIAAFADAIKRNTDKKEWSVRYFAAQAYLDLYGRTDNWNYLQEAYNIAYDNVTILLDEQRKLNAVYLADVQELTAEEPDYRFLNEAEKEAKEKEYKAEKNRVKEYNKTLKEARKTELPPIYEPLALNCELLFALADEMKIGRVGQKEIEAILQTSTNGVFLTKPINDRYSFSEAGDYSIEFSGKNIVIPADLLSTSARILVSVQDGGKTTTFDDFVVTEVKREGEELGSFRANVSSKEIKDYPWTGASRVTVQIINGDATMEFHYKVGEFKDKKIIADKVVFVEE